MAPVRWKPWVRWAPCFVLALTSVPARSQTRDPQPTEAPATASEPANPPHWQFALGLLASYDSNVDFLTEEGTGDYAGSLRASVGRNWRGPRRQVGLTAAATAVAYRELRDADHLDGSLGLNWSQQLGRKVAFTLSGFGAYQNTASALNLTEIGLQLPRSQSRSYGGNAGLDFKLGQHTSLRLAGRYDRVTFDEKGLVDSEAAGADASLAHQVGRRDEVSLSYGFLRTKDPGRSPLENHFGTFGWSRTLSRHLSLRLAGGAGYNPGFAGLGQQWYLHGSVGLQGHWRRAVLALEGRQSVTPAFGLGGNQLSDTAFLSATLPLGRKTELSIGGNHTWGRERTGGSTAYMSDEARISLNVRLLRYAGVSLGYSYRRNDLATAPAVGEHQAFFGVTYTRP